MGFGGTLIRIRSVSNLLHRYFFFQAEDGIRDVAVTGVQTCALPISTAAQLAAITALESDFTATRKLWQAFQASDLPALNRQLKSAGLAELKPASASGAAKDEDGDIA